MPIHRLHAMADGELQATTSPGRSRVCRQVCSHVRYVGRQIEAGQAKPGMRVGVGARVSVCLCVCTYVCVCR
jgi:hypothetical protein